MSQSDVATIGQEQLDDELAHAVRVAATHNVRKYLQMGADVSKGALLLSAVKAGSHEIFDLLLAANAPLDVLGGFLPESALHRAASTTDGYYFNTLLEAGADPNVLGTMRGTVFTEIMQSHHLPDSEKLARIVKLLNAGANPNIRSGGLYSLLYHAVGRGHNNIAQVLLDAGADPNSNETGIYRPLHRAVIGKNIVAIIMLLAAGANVDNDDITEASSRALKQRLQIVRDSKLARFEPPSLRELSAALSWKQALVSSLSEEEQKALLPQELIDAVATARRRNRVTTQEWRDFVEETFAS